MRSGTSSSKNLARCARLPTDHGSHYMTRFEGADWRQQATSPRSWARSRDRSGSTWKHWRKSAWSSVARPASRTSRRPGRGGQRRLLRDTGGRRGPECRAVPQQRNVLAVRRPATAVGQRRRATPHARVGPRRRSAQRQVLLTADELRDVQAEFERVLEPYLTRPADEASGGASHVRLLSYFMPEASQRGHERR